MITTLDGLPWSCDLFIWGMCARRKWLLSTDSGKSTHKNKLNIIREKKMGATKDQDFTIQRRYLKWWGIWRTQFLKILLSILSIWIRNDAIMNEEDDEAKIRSLPTKQIKISIPLSFHDIVLLCTCLYSDWCVMHDRMFALMTVYY